MRASRHFKQRLCLSLFLQKLAPTLIFPALFPLLSITWVIILSCVLLMWAYVLFRQAPALSEDDYALLLDRALEADHALAHAWFENRDPKALQLAAPEELNWQTWLNTHCPLPWFRVLPALVVLALCHLEGVQNQWQSWVASTTPGERSLTLADSQAVVVAGQNKALEPDEFDHELVLIRVQDPNTSQEDLLSLLVSARQAGFENDQSLAQAFARRGFELSRQNKADPVKGSAGGLVKSSDQGSQAAASQGGGQSSQIEVSGEPALQIPWDIASLSPVQAPEPWQKPLIKRWRRAWQQADERE